MNKWNDERLAVLIGSQARGLKHTAENINSFLQLFNVPYDVYICSDADDLGNFNTIKNIKQCISLEQVEGPSKKLRDNFSNLLPSHYWQNAKIIGVANLFKTIRGEYTHALKMRTDFIFDYKKLFNDYGHNTNSVDIEHLEFIMDFLRLNRHHCNTSDIKRWWRTSNTCANTSPIMYNGDRYMFGAATKIWQYCSTINHTAANLKNIHCSWYPIPYHHDYSVFDESLEKISIPKPFFPDSRPATGRQIAEFLNNNKDYLNKFNKQKYTGECYEPIDKTWMNQCNQNKYGSEKLAQIHCLYTSQAIPTNKHGVTQYMKFTRFNNNDRENISDNDTIRMKDNTSKYYEDNKLLQTKLIEIKSKIIK